MARFILDIANLSKEEIKQVLVDVTNTYAELNKVAGICCIDETNSNQFHNEGFKNNLSNRQLKNYGRLITSD